VEQLGTVTKGKEGFNKSLLIFYGENSIDIWFSNL
jgi:hypothetical protein